MKFTTPSNLLREHLSTVSKVISNKTKHTIMESVLFEINGDALQLTATDGETRLISQMPIEEKSGNDISFTVKAKQLLEPLSEIANQNLTLELNEENMLLELTYSNGYFAFPVQAGAEFPEAEALSGTTMTLTMPVGTFLQGVEHCIYAASNEEIRPLMMGVHLDVRPEHITFAATDGFMLAWYRNSNLGGQVSEPTSFTLQRKPANLLKGILAQEGDSEPLTIEVFRNYATFITPTLELQCRLLEGKYPNYESVVPKGNDKVLEVDRQLLLGAFRRVSIFANETMNLVTLEIQPNSLRLKASDIDFSTSAEETIPASFSQDQTLNISFQAQHFIQVLSILGGDNVTISLGDKAHAALISPSNMPEGVNILAAVMPLVY